MISVLQAHVEYEVYSFRELGLEETTSVTYQKWFKKLNHPWAGIVLP